MDISVVIPLLNEEESLPELVEWLHRVLTNRFSFEIIMIDDGSTDKSWEVIQNLKVDYSSLRGIRFQRNYGKSAALNEGFKMAKGEVVFTMDADLQDSPDELPSLHKMITEEGYDLVSGWKKKRFDPLSKTIPTKLFNWATRKTSGIELHDFNCGLKAYKKEVVKSIEVYGEMHRYVPILAKNAGFKNIGEKTVIHQARKYGTTKFGLDRFVNGFLDLLSINFVGKFGKKPMHFFGTIGTLMFLIGFVLFLSISIDKLIHIFNHTPAKNIADISWFYVALVSMIIGVQLFLAGFIGELISRNSVERNKYLIKERFD